MNLFVRQRILISRLFIWPLAMSLFITDSAWEIFPLVDGLLFIIGCTLVGLATIGRLWCSLYICGRKTKELVTTGPYSMCRHPLYFFSAVGALGVGLTTETFTIPAILTLMFALFYTSVIRAEEIKMQAIHGEEYATYVSATPQFFPRLTLYHEPVLYEVEPAKYRREMFDALWFVWLVGIIEFVESLREAGFIPIILKLY